jgi:hypothetical protein
VAQSMRIMTQRRLSQQVNQRTSLSRLSERSCMLLAAVIDNGFSSLLSNLLTLKQVLRSVVSALGLHVMTHCGTLWSPVCGSLDLNCRVTAAGARCGEARHRSRHHLGLVP